MTEGSKTGKARKRVKILELNRETMEDLSETDAAVVRGGLKNQTQEACSNPCPDTAV
jgi:hypothetical protein